MLHMLGQEQLSRSLFPVGGMPKAETRAHAERFGLPVASKPDSQELCFAPSGDAGAFVRSTAPQLVRAGEVVDADGSAVATHDGTFGFTVGQRRGLGVATGARNYVVEVDAGANRVVVGPQALLSRSGLVADRVSWVAGSAPDDGPFEAAVRIRYRGDDVAGGDRAARGRPDAGGVPRAPASRGAGPERRDLPRRRVAGRRAHHRSAPLTSRAGRTLGLSSERPGSYEEVESLLKLLRRKTKSFDIQVRTSRCTSRHPRTSPRSRVPRRSRSGSSSSPTRCATRSSAVQAAAASRAGGRARHRSRDGRRGRERGRGADVHVPRAP